MGIEGEESMATQTTDSYPTTPDFPRAGNFQIFEPKKGDYCVRTDRRAIPGGDVGRCRVRRLASELTVQWAEAPTTCTRCVNLVKQTGHHHADRESGPVSRLPLIFDFAKQIPRAKMRWIPMIQAIHKGRVQCIVYSVCRQSKPAAQYPDLATTSNNQRFLVSCARVQVASRHR